MSRISRVFLLTGALMFALACNFITRPLDQAQQAVETVQSIATALPIETLQAFPSALPEIEVPTGMPDIGMPTGMPDFGNMADPKDPPLTEWNGIPVIPSATAGNESSGIYSYKAAATIAEVFDYYKAEMPTLGWNEFFSMPDSGSGALLTFERENGIATITITASGDGVLVFLASQ